MVELKPGARFQSTVCSTEVIVVKGAGEVDLTCGGAPMVASGTGEISGSPSDDAAGGTQLGKRYGNADETIELLATKAGDGSLAAKIDEGGTVRAGPVELGRSGAEQVFVSGLPDGARLLTFGQAFVEDGDAVRVASVPAS